MLSTVLSLQKEPNHLSKTSTAIQAGVRRLTVGLPWQRHLSGLTAVHIPRFRTNKKCRCRTNLHQSWPRSRSSLRGLTNSLTPSQLDVTVDWLHLYCLFLSRVSGAEGHRQSLWAALRTDQQLWRRIPRIPRTHGTVKTRKTLKIRVLPRIRSSHKSHKGLKIFWAHRIRNWHETK
jgi:hypothetical protein